MFNLSDDDSFSTQLEGKKLKNRGAKLEGNVKAGKEVNIAENSPNVGIDADEILNDDLRIDQGLSPEDELDRHERLKKERLAAQKQQVELQKQVEPSPQVKDPNGRLNEIEQGILQSQNKGKPTIETEFKQHHNPDLKEDIATEQHADDRKLRKTDIVAAHALLGDNAKNLDFSDDIKLAEKQAQKPIAATALPDIREKSPELER